MEREGFKVELLLCCGDFQSLRNIADLICKASPDHHKEMGTFYKYYSGEKVAPVMTIFIGGNHEASNYLQELPYGGWVAPNIYYLGYAGVVEFNGFRIAGLSGIFKGYDYLKGRYESPPYDEESIRSVYHIRNIDVFRLRQLTNGKPDFVMSHDWPCGIHSFGDAEELFSQHKKLRRQVGSKVNTLGSPPTWEVMETLKPEYWFAAHLHIKYAAIVQHEDGSKTNFLALDKCLPDRDFLQILTVGSNDTSATDSRLRFDPEWLAILRLTNDLISVENKNVRMPSRQHFNPTKDQIDEVVQLLGGNLEIPENFVATEKPYDPNRDQGMLWRTPNPSRKINLQTEWLCSRLGIDDPLDLLLSRRQDNRNNPTKSSPQNNSTRSRRKEAMSVTVEADFGKLEVNQSSDKVE